MGLILIDSLDDKVVAALEERAREHGRTLSDEAKAVLEAALDPEKSPASKVVNLAAFIRDRVDRFGGEDLDLPKRLPMVERVTLS
jgi:plasmid stability protein